MKIRKEEKNKIESKVDSCKLVGSTCKIDNPRILKFSVIINNEGGKMKIEKNKKSCIINNEGEKMKWIEKIKTIEKVGGKNLYYKINGAKVYNPSRKSLLMLLNDFKKVNKLTVLEDFTYEEIACLGWDIEKYKIMNQHIQMHNGLLEEIVAMGNYFYWNNLLTGVVDKYFYAEARRRISWLLQINSTLKAEKNKGLN